MKSIAITVWQIIARKKHMLRFRQPIVERIIGIIKFCGEGRVCAPFYAIGLVVEHGLP
jgi:hypothetical protein